MAAMAVSCGPVDDSSKAQPEELGLPTKEIVVGYRGEETPISIWSNLKGSVHAIEDEASWALLSQYSFSGDTDFILTTEMNDDFPRMMHFEFVTDGNERRDTLTVKQKGLFNPRLEIPNNSALIMNAQGDTKIPINTNIALEDMEVVVAAVDSAKWITSFTISNGNIVIKTEDNPSETDLRNAAITFTFFDGWGEKYTQTLYLTQANSKNEFGSPISFEDARDLTDGQIGVPVEIKDYYFIEGIVVSNPTSLNAFENPQITNTQVDYTGTTRSFAFESLDGKYGFKITAETEDENVLARYTQAQILLRGLTITRKADPDRYEITGFKASQLLASEQKSASDVPVKKLSMAQLKDSDIYTYVTLQDVEFVIKKGSLTPVNEGYTNAHNAHRSNKHPLLIRDAKDGSSMYTLTNTTCRYRRDGSKLPYGVGEFSGVIVHEKHRPFVDFDADTPDDSEYGTIGRYQIRHQERADIAMPDARDYSNVLVEFNYHQVGESRALAATYGSGSLIHTYASYTSAMGTALYTGGSWPYLGPVGTNASYAFGLNTGNKHGCGLYDTAGNEILGPGSGYDEYINADGKGNVTGSTRPCPAWGNAYWWHKSDSAAYAYVLGVSTKGVTAKKLSLQVSQLNTSQGKNAAGVNDGTNIGTPRFWKIQYFVGASYPADDSSDWVDLPDSEYTVPDVVIWSNTLFSQSPGFKCVDFELPVELLGQDQVWIAVRPSRNVASSGVDYADTVIRTDGNAPSYMEYLALRICQ